MSGDFLEGDRRLVGKLRTVKCHCDDNRTPQGSGPRRKPVPGAATVAKSAFDDEERYTLTALGKQFMHYAMTELTLKLQYHPDVDFSDREGEPPSPTPFQPTLGDAG